MGRNVTHFVQRFPHIVYSLGIVSSVLSDSEPKKDFAGLPFQNVLFRNMFIGVFQVFQATLFIPRLQQDIT